MPEFQKDEYKNEANKIHITSSEDIDHMDSS